jgi:uncharacterized membrane protein YtjA (UPF0391 family)
VAVFGLEPVGRDARSEAAAVSPRSQGVIMFQLLLFCIVVAVIAGALGFTGIAAGAATIAKIIFFLMLAGIALMLILAAMGLAILF